MSSFSVIAAYEKETRLIGLEKDKEYSFPWGRNKEDMKHFQDVTIGNPPLGKINAVIMGRKTWESLPFKSRPLPGRFNIVLTNNSLYLINEQMRGCSSLDRALKFCEESAVIDKVYVIGGQSVYEKSLRDKRCRKLILTEVEKTETDNFVYHKTYFPHISDNFVLKKTQNLNPRSRILTYKNKYDYFSDEYEYLNSLREIMKKGEDKLDRTQIGTRSLFGQVLRFSLKEKNGFISFPLLTTKRMFYRGILEELLFFLRGNVDNQILNDKNVHIWDGNTTREFLDKQGLDYMEEGSLGKAYGFQWRHWGANWEGKNANYTGKGHDQIRDILNQLKVNPFSRRIVLSAWNVSDLKEMCLPPCHTMYVFNVSIVNGEKRLFCHLTQRSGDMFLGVPFNIASTALLLLIIAKASGIKPGGIMLSIVDAHIYQNHFTQVEKQLKRTPYKFPKIKIDKDLNGIEDIEKLTFEDFKVINYNYHPGIKAEMAI